MMTMKDKYPEFTKKTLNATWDRDYMVFYRTKDMKRCGYFYMSSEENVNMDPTKPIVPRPDRVKSHFGIEDICRRFRLMDEFLRNDPNLKIFIIDTRNAGEHEVVMAVGENGKWKIRENYEGVLRTFLVGKLPDIKFMKAA